MPQILRLKVIPKLKPLYQAKERFIDIYGGRGSAKSWTVADFLLVKGYQSKKRILCGREIQNSIKDSVHKLLSDRIAVLKLDSFYTIKNDSIVGNNGTEFIFKGLLRNPYDIKSMEGIDYCWCFIAGTLIDGKPIETIIPGDNIKSYNHNAKIIEYKKVLKITKRKVPNIIYKLLTTDASKYIIATGEHPVFVKGKGYTPIKFINKGDIIYAENEFTGICKMFRGLWRRYTNKYTCSQTKICKKWRNLLHRLCKEKTFRTNENIKSYEQSCDKSKNDKIAKGYWSQAMCIRRQWERIYKSTTIAIRKTWQRLVERISYNGWSRSKNFRMSNTLQSRFSKYILQISNRMRWDWSFWNYIKIRRSKERSVLKEYRVDSIEIQKQDDIKQLGLSDEGNYVYNLEVEINNNYFANNILVHNCEEAHSISRKSLEILIPTIRKEDSQIIFTYNPTNEDDPVHKDYTLSNRPDVLRIECNHSDNPFFPDVLKKEMEWDRANDTDKYNHIWEGKCLKHSEAQIMNGRWVVYEFDSPNIQFDTVYFGADWGFANDPTCLVRDFIVDNTLFIDYEVGGIGVELDDIPAMFDKIEGSRKFTIKADSSRPETISYIHRKGFNIRDAEKWPGSVEDGIAFLRSFDKIVIHPRCKNTIDEFKLYSYKTDPKTGEILPIIIDKHNHYIDAIRYSMDGMVKNNKAILDRF